MKEPLMKNISQPRQVNITNAKYSNKKNSLDSKNELFQHQVSPQNCKPALEFEEQSNQHIQEIYNYFDDTQIF